MGIRYSWFWKKTGKEREGVYLVLQVVLEEDGKEQKGVYLVLQVVLEEDWEEKGRCVPGTLGSGRRLKRKGKVCIW